MALAASPSFLENYSSFTGGNSKIRQGIIETGSRGAGMVSVKNSLQNLEVVASDWKSSTPNAGFIISFRLLFMSLFVREASLYL